MKVKMNDYKMTLIKNSGGTHDIATMIGNLEWSDSIDSLGMEVKFDCFRNLEDRYMKNKDVVELGDKLVLSNKGNEIFQGIIADLGIDQKVKKITAFDFAFYLNQSNAIKQFNKIPAKTAITQLCGEFGVPVGNITSMPTKINKIYNGDTVSEIIKDIIVLDEKSTGNKYRLEMRAGKLYIEKYSDLVITPKYKPAINLQYINPLDVIQSFSYSQSITEMKNKVVVSSGDEKKVNIKATEQDAGSIKKFGILQSVESLNDKEKGDVKSIAKNKLKELNKVTEDLKITVLGDDTVRAGRVIELKNELYNLKGKYLIKECSHTFHNDVPIMSLNLSRM